ncbi:MAG: hypothetical protein AAF989_13310, partial [Planctomycetota bacterium]
GYMESLHFAHQHATVGGWDASRLQYARFRVFATGDFMAPDELRGESMMEVQRRDDLARWYAHSIMQTHFMMDGETEGESVAGDGSASSDRVGGDRAWVLSQLATLYRIDLPIRRLRRDPGVSVAAMKSFLSIDDVQLTANPTDESLTELCLAGCEVTSAALATIPPQPDLRWLDLSRLPIGVDDASRIVLDPGTLQQLNLEATRIDATVADWLRGASRLTELDLSWTKVDDRLAAVIPKMPALRTLWLTGSKVGDRTAAAVQRLSQLEAVDLQRTEVSNDGLRSLRSAGGQLQINPLQLRAATP